MCSGLRSEFSEVKIKPLEVDKSGNGFKRIKTDLHISVIEKINKKTFAADFTVLPN